MRFNYDEFLLEVEDELGRVETVIALQHMPTDLQLWNKSVTVEMQLCNFELQVREVVFAVLEDDRYRVYALSPSYNSSVIYDQE